MRRALLLAGPFVAALAGCTSSPGWVGTVQDAGPVDCTATTIPSIANAIVAPGASWTGEFTFEGWFRIDAAAAAPYGRIAGVSATGSCSTGVSLWEIRVDPSGQVTGTLGSAYTATGAGANVGLGRWFHVAIQYEGVGTGALYVNGTAVQTYATASTTMMLPSGCEVRLASADDTVSNRVPISVASLRYRRFKHYVSGFAPERVLTRDADTLYLFDPAIGDAFPLTDGIYGFTAMSVVPTASGPGC